MEICQLCYANADERSPKSILRIHNITFKHALYCINSLRNRKAISHRKMFGIYFHALTTHLPQMARMFAPSQLHTEDEERQFSYLNQISRSTSSRTNESVRDNGIIRLQIEQSVNEKNGTQNTNLESKISKLSKCIMSQKENSTFNLDEIPQEIFQLHLQRISHYLICGENVWWHHEKYTNDIIFHNGTSEPCDRPEGPQLTDFTEKTTAKVVEEISELYQTCLKTSNLTLPNSVKQAA